MEPEKNYYPVDVPKTPSKDEPSFNTPTVVPSTSNIIPAPNGTIMAGGTMQSPNFSHNNSGWRIDSNGNVEFGNGQFRGDITGASGTFSGTISGGSIDIGGADTSSMHVDAVGNMWLGAATYNIATNPFAVSNAGLIRATLGTIGGTTITATELYGGIIKSSATVGAGTTGWIGDSDGLRGYDSVLGNTFNLPTDGSAPTFSSGIINSTIFNINTNAVLRTSTTVGDGTANSAGILINNTGLYGCEANQTLANANLKALVNGTIVIKGAITANTGYIGGVNGWTIATGSIVAVAGANDVEMRAGIAAGDFANTGAASGFIFGLDHSDSDKAKFFWGTPTNYVKYDGTTFTVLGTTDIQIFTNIGANTWTKPTGAQNVVVTVVGAGGGAGTSGGGSGYSSGGGGGGAINSYSFMANLLSPTVTVTVGAKGVGGVIGGTDGTDGGDTTFGSYLTAGGGKKSLKATSSQSGGAGGTATGGINGGDGGAGEASSFGTGGGGGGAGGGTGGRPTAGTAGNTFSSLGAGGAGGTDFGSLAPGHQGTNYGGGGGGGASNNNGGGPMGAAGADGAPGYVIIATYK